MPRTPPFLPPPLLLLLLLLQLEVLGQEVGDSGAVNAVGATQRLHHQERSFPRGVLRCGPATSDTGGVSCPSYGVVQLVLHLLLGPGGKLPAPWRAVRGVHLAGRVVHHRYQGCSDRLLAARVATTSAVVRHPSRGCQLDSAMARGYTWEKKETQTCSSLWWWWWWWGGWRGGTR